MATLASMDMPPSGWYPDPYEVPDLLRWWDGSTWTEHTQAFEATAQGAQQRGGAGTAEPATSLDLPPVATARQPSAGSSPATSLDLPPASLNLPPASRQPAPPLDLPAAFQAPDNTTRVFSQDDYLGYARAVRHRRRRRLWMMALLGVVTLAILGAMALVVSKYDKQPAKPAAALNTAPATVRHATAPPSASPTPSPAPSGPTVTDSATGLSYALLNSPWRAQCPQGLSGQVFSWTAGEFAVAGQVAINGQEDNWYGNACSGPLPQQYGYNGVQDLMNTTQNLSNAFQNDYYQGVQHTVSTVGPSSGSPLTVSGHAAWEDKFLVTYQNAASAGMAWTSEMGAVVVVDRGAGQAPAVLYISVPSNLGENNVDTLVSSLRIPGSHPNATPSPTAARGGGGNNP